MACSLHLLLIEPFICIIHGFTTTVITLNTIFIINAMIIKYKNFLPPNYFIYHYFEYPDCPPLNLF